MSSSAGEAAGRVTPEMRKFLEKLAPHTKPLTRGQIGCITTRAQDRARQACRRLGLAAYKSPHQGRDGWVITSKGRSALADIPAPLAPAGGDGR